MNGMQKVKKILFLSALDFKEKSIQVIRKTPEAYSKAGWQVYYIVARDNSKYGNYFYEREINPEGIKVIRFYWPLQRIRDTVESRILRTILNKIAGYIVVFKLVLEGFKLIRKEEIDALYGYEVHGVLASHLLKLLGKFLLRKKFVHVVRFQGTKLSNVSTFKLLLNIDELVALWLPADLCIMTDDGTQGDAFLRKIKSRLLRDFRFYVNGIDDFKVSKSVVESVKRSLGLTSEKVFLTVCRLVSWKRVDRVIEVVNILVNKYNFRNFKHYIIGDGTEKKRLEDLVKRYELQNYIEFLGALPNEEVKKYYNVADIVILTYDVSNVGNPLLEAIRANNIIFTLNNGDTGKWITHYYNGFIYDINDELYEKMAQDILNVINNKELYEYIKNNIRKTEKEKLWTWDERMNAEIKDVENLTKKLNNENKI